MTRRSKRLRAFLEGRRFDVVLNATAFSARLDDGARERRSTRSMRRCCRWCWLESASMSGAPPSAGWGPRILRCMSRCRRSTDASSLAPYPSRRRARATRGPNSARSRIGRSPTASTSPPSSLAAGRALRRKAPSDKRLACVLPDYPARGGRTGYAVGLDTPASAVAICETLRAAGYDVACDTDASSLIAALERRAARGDADAGRI